MAQKPKVLQDQRLPEVLQPILESVCHPIPWDLLTTGTEDQRKEIQGIFTYGHPAVDAKVLDAFPSLKVVSNFGVGVDHINLTDARERSIPVGNTPDCLNDTVADMAFALLLGSARNLIQGDAFTRDPETKKFNMAWFGAQVSGKTIGIVGFGRIGQKIAKRANGFDMKILYYCRNRKTEIEDKFEATYASLEQLLQESDFVVLIVPLTSETRNLIGRTELQLMKKTAFLINVARGGVVEHDALLEALENNWIAGAGLDVTEPEPLPRDHRLLANKKVTFTPHFGSATLETRRKMTEMSVENLRLGLEEKKLNWSV